MAAPLPEQDRGAAVSRLRVLLADSGTAPAQHQTSADAPPIEVPLPLRELVRSGQLQRGTVVALPSSAPSVQGGVSYLALALAAAATAAGAWCGVVGVPSFGIAAAAGLGANLARHLLLDEPGDRWADAVAIMAVACDLVLCRPSHPVGAGHERRIRARIRRSDRQRGAVLIVLGEWPGADLRLTTVDAQWSGLGHGRGHLTGRLVTVVATGRAAVGFGASTRLWLPDGTGAIREQTRIEQPGPDTEQVPRRLRMA